MDKPFCEIKLYPVKPDKTEAFEALAAQMREAQLRQPGCRSVQYVKRFYTFDGVENGAPPRALTKVVKCVKYIAFEVYDSRECCGQANGWFFDHYAKAAMKLTIMPFEILSGYALPGPAEPQICETGDAPVVSHL